MNSLPLQVLQIELRLLFSPSVDVDLDGPPEFCLLCKMTNHELVSWIVNCDRRYLPNLLFYVDSLQILVNDVYLWDNVRHFVKLLARAPFPIFSRCTVAFIGILLIFHGVRFEWQWVIIVGHLEIGTTELWTVSFQFGDNNLALHGTKWNIDFGNFVSKTFATSFVLKRLCAKFSHRKWYTSLTLGNKPSLA